MLNSLLYQSDLFSIGIIVGGAFLTTFILSHIDGWYKISKKYRRQNPTNGKLFPFAFMFLGPMCKYSGLVFVRVGEEALDISIIMPFGFINPPLLIPWGEFVSCTETRFYLSKCIQLTLKEPKSYFYFKGDLADEIERCYHQFSTRQTSETYLHCVPKKS